MRRLLLSILLGLAAAGCSRAPEPRAVALLHTGAAEPELAERLAAYAEAELQVPVRRAFRPVAPAEFRAFKKAAKRQKRRSDVLLIVLGAWDDPCVHLSVYAKEGLALVNVPALRSGDPEQTARRIERQVMRAAAFGFGLQPAADWFCVTRDYNSLAELDGMGRNFSPPQQRAFADAARGRGLAAAGE